MKIYYRRYFLRYLGFINFSYIKKQMKFNFQPLVALVEPRCYIIQTRNCIATASPYYTGASFYSKDEAVKTKFNTIQQF